jgi:hypothetical protein
MVSMFHSKDFAAIPLRKSDHFDLYKCKIIITFSMDWNLLVGGIKIL